MGEVFRSFELGCICGPYLPTSRQRVRLLVVASREAEGTPVLKGGVGPTYSIHMLASIRLADDELFCLCDPPLR